MERRIARIADPSVPIDDQFEYHDTLDASRLRDRRIDRIRRASPSPAGGCFHPRARHPRGQEAAVAGVGGGGTPVRGRQRGRRTNPPAALNAGAPPCDSSARLRAWHESKVTSNAIGPSAGRLVLPLPDRVHRRYHKGLAWRCDDLLARPCTSLATARQRIPAARPPHPALRTSATRPCRSTTIRTPTVDHVARVVAGVLRQRPRTSGVESGSRA